MNNKLQVINMKIAPSLLSADFTKLSEEIKLLEEAGADYLHVDIMDGHFVPNLTFGAMIIKHIRPLTKLPLDVHLMVSNPELHIDACIKAGADIITIHYESTNHHHRLIQQIKSQGIQAGIALNPSTASICLEYIIKYLDVVTVMSVNPGFAGQTFIVEQLDKIKNIKQNYSNKYNFLIEVDGGVNSSNAKAIALAGADILVAGSAVFANFNYKDNINKLREE